MAFLHQSGSGPRVVVGALVVGDFEAPAIESGLDAVAQHAACAYGDGHGAGDAAPPLDPYALWHHRGAWAGLRGRPRAALGVYRKAVAVVAEQDVQIALQTVLVPGGSSPAGHVADPPGPGPVPPGGTGPVHGQVAASGVHGRTPGASGGGRCVREARRVALRLLLERLDALGRRTGDQVVVVHADRGDAQLRARLLRDHPLRTTHAPDRGRTYGHVTDTVHLVSPDASRLAQAAALVTYLHARRTRTAAPVADVRGAAGAPGATRRGGRTPDSAWDPLWYGLLPRVRHNRVDVVPVPDPAPGRTPVR